MVGRGGGEERKGERANNTSEYLSEDAPAPEISMHHLILLLRVYEMNLGPQSLIYNAEIQKV